MKPIEQPGLIPLHAVAREPVFFFGSLMHERVLSFVLDRPLVTGELAPARLKGYRRMRAFDASYPVLIEEPRFHVDGLIWTARSQRDLVRVNHFEEDEYEACRVEVHHADGAATAWAYLGLPHLPVSDEPWHIDHLSADLERFLEQCRHWMQDAPL